MLCSSWKYCFGLIVYIQFDPAWLGWLCNQRIFLHLLGLLMLGHIGFFLAQSLFQTVRVRLSGLNLLLSCDPLY